MTLTARGSGEPRGAACAAHAGQGWIALRVSTCSAVYFPDPADCTPGPWPFRQKC